MKNIKFFIILAVLLLGSSLSGYALPPVEMSEEGARFTIGISATEKTWDVTCERVDTNAWWKFKQDTHPVWHTIQRGEVIKLVNEKNGAEEEPTVSFNTQPQPTDENGVMLTIYQYPDAFFYEHPYDKGAGMEFIYIEFKGDDRFIGLLRKERGDQFALYELEGKLRNAN